VRSQRGLIIVAAVAIGIVIGLGSFTFVYAKGYSYLTKSPEACANCHIMDEHYAAWLKSSHSANAGCNDCHTPHALIPKYVTKARNGFWHSFYFTTGNYPDPLRITERNHDIVELACRDCHERTVAAMHPGADTPPNEVIGGRSSQGVECTHCHRYVGHQVR
jgi:cytochrome c nitrite reductase small subunit